MEEITSQEEEMKDLRQKLYDVEAEINKVWLQFCSSHDSQERVKSSK